MGLALVAMVCFVTALLAGTVRPQQLTGTPARCCRGEQQIPNVP